MPVCLTTAIWGDQMTSEKIEIQRDSVKTPQSVSVGWAGLSAVSAIALVVWLVVTTVVDPLLIAPHVILIFCLASLALMTVGLVLHMATLDEAMVSRLATLIQHNTWAERAVLMCVMTVATTVTVAAGWWIGGETGRLLESALLPAAGFASVALIAFSVSVAGEIRPLHWTWVVLILFWMLGLGGLVFLTLSGMFFVLPFWLVAAVAFCFVAGGGATWWILRQQKINSDGDDSNAISQRDRKLGLYQAGFVPLFCLGAVATLATPQLTPIYVLVGLVTFVFGIRKLIRVVAG